MRKWITKAEITKILNTYGMRQNEFEPIEKLDYCYKNIYTKGYIITILEEENYGEKTGRILVSHSRGDGKRTYNDIWERDKNGNLQFCFRNLWNQPFSDSEYIKDLEEQIQQLKSAGQKLQEQLNSQKQIVSEKINLEYQKLKDENKTLHTLLENANQEKTELLEQISTLKKSQKLNNDTTRNPRHAGRKKLGESPKTIEKLEQVKSLLEKEWGEQEIIKKLEISRATFYRYKKSINN